MRNLTDDVKTLQMALRLVPLCRGSHPNMELAIYNPLNPTVIYLGDWRKGRTIFNTHDINEWDTKRYDTIAAIIGDGWKID